jgi:lysophospholipase L1-like esterase
MAETSANAAPPRRIPRWLLSGAALVAAAICAEIALRVLDLPREDELRFFNRDLDLRGVFEPDPDLFWRLRSDQSCYVANRIGTRGWLPAAGAKGARDFRIACVGDSCTFGLNVRYEECWGVQLERMLRERLPAWRVGAILAANPGYSTFQNRILFERDVVPLQPDVTVLYCGGWNDYVPAIGESDAERAARARSWSGKLRLPRLLRRIAGRRLEAYVEAFKRGEALDGRRVPLADFDANLAAMIRAAQQAGSTVIVVLPPLSAKCSSDHPIALEYRAAARALASAHGLAIVDAPALFAAQHARAPEDWRALPEGEWPCLEDWVHPTVTGHRVIAQALFEILRAHGPLVAAAQERARASALRIDAVAPERLRPIIDERVTVRGCGFSTADAFDRVWIGEWWVSEVRVVDDERLELRVPRALPPGRHRLSLSTPQGIVGADAEIEILAPSLRAELARDGARLRIRLFCEGAPHDAVGAWMAAGLRPAPADTRYGPFWLAGEREGRPQHAPDAPFYFERTGLVFKLLRHAAAGGPTTWCETIDVDTSRFATLPDELCFQGLVVVASTPGNGVLTEPARAPLPR